MRELAGEAEGVCEFLLVGGKGEISAAVYVDSSVWDV